MSTQSYSSHARFHPPFHFFLMPVLLITVVMAVVGAIRVPNFASWWLVLLSLAALTGAFLIRTNALKVQDRVIRLEERLRLSMLLPDQLRPRITELTESQLIALRFAPDAELPELVSRTLANQWQAKQIKQAIQNWRADHFRV